MKKHEQEGTEETEWDIHHSPESFRGQNSEDTKTLSDKAEDF